MAKKKLQKTNAMRELERAKVSFALHEYEVDEADLSGIHVAAQLGQDPACVFKTLVTDAASGEHVVCCIPVADELDLKAAARVVGEKSLGMMPVRYLHDVTGYVRGGCSPVGMRKVSRTVIDRSCENFATIMISGGRRGLQIELAPRDLIAFCHADVADICLDGDTHDR